MGSGGNEKEEDCAMVSLDDFGFIDAMLIVEMLLLITALDSFAAVYSKPPPAVWRILNHCFHFMFLQYTGKPALKAARRQCGSRTHRAERNHACEYGKCSTLCLYVLLLRVRMQPLLL